MRKELAEIESALARLLEVEKVLVEGAAAAGLAAVLANANVFRGKRVGLILSGGNLDMRILSNVIIRELTREGRIQSLSIDIEDRRTQRADARKLGAVGRAQSRRANFCL